MLPTDSVVLDGNTLMDCTTGAVAVSMSLGEVIPFRLAVILLVPVFTAVAKPLGLIVATDGVPEAHVTWLVRSIIEPSEKVPVAVNCCVSPLGTDGFTGATAIVCNVAAVTVSVSAAEVTPSKLAVMLLVPTPTPVARPAALTVATDIVAELQVTWLVMSCWLPSE